MLLLMESDWRRQILLQKKTEEFWGFKRETKFKAQTTTTQKKLLKSKYSKNISAFLHISPQSVWAKCWFFSLKKDAELFSEQRPSIFNHYRLMFENWKYYVFHFWIWPLHLVQNMHSRNEYRIRIHESKMRAILFKYAQLRCAQLSTWGPCARASKCGKKLLLHDVLAWPLRWSSAFRPKASSAHALAFTSC